MRIAILDSGVNTELAVFNHCEIISYQVSAQGQVVAGGSDSYGHGTAVAAILAKEIPEGAFISIKIFEGEDGCTDENLLSALRFLLEIPCCEFINISAGIAQGRITELYELCQALVQQGSCIVSGFDNNGAVSYPAAFPCVYGVDTAKECRRWQDYIYIEHSVVNFLARGGSQHVVWNDASSRLVEGSSFSTPYRDPFALQISGFAPIYTARNI